MHRSRDARDVCEQLWAPVNLLWLPLRWHHARHAGPLPYKAIHLGWRWRRAHLGVVSRSTSCYTTFFFLREPSSSCLAFAGGRQEVPQRERLGAFQMMMCSLASVRPRPLWRKCCHSSVFLNALLSLFCEALVCIVKNSILAAVYSTKTFWRVVDLSC